MTATPLPSAAARRSACWQLAVFPDTDFARLAQGVGIPASTVRRVDELDALRPWIEDPVGPYLIDCKVDPNRIADWAAQALSGWRDPGE